MHDLNNARRGVFKIICFAQKHISIANEDWVKLLEYLRDNQLIPF